MGRGILPIVLVLAAAIGSAAQGFDAPYLPERQTECWECHRDWPHTPEPLRSFYNILPETTDATPGDTFELDVQVQNAWYHDIRYLEPVLDLTHAPSLKFFDGRDPAHQSKAGVVDMTPRAPGSDPSHIIPDTSTTMGPYSGHVVVDVPQGATRLTLRMNETTPNVDPPVTWNIYAGRDTPGEDPDFTILPTDPQILRLEGPGAFAGLGFGNWTIEAQVDLVPPDGSQPSPGEVTFRVDADTAFEAGSTRVGLLSRHVRLEPFQSTLFTWTLQSVRPPGPGESVGLTVNGTAFYLHPATANANDDWGNVTKGLELGLVSGPDGRFRLEPDTALITVTTPRADVGVSLVALLEAVGYASTFLIIASIYSGGIFGRPSRRHLNHLFGTARRRVAFHNALSYGLTLAALVHTALFLWTDLADETFHWTLGILWGGIALLAMFGLGVTGALQVQIIRRWNYATWRWTHLGLAVLTMVFTALHLLLDGVHFDAVQDWLGYHNPLDPRSA